MVCYYGNMREQRTHFWVFCCCCFLFCPRRERKQSGFPVHFKTNKSSLRLSYCLFLMLQFRGGGWGGIGLSFSGIWMNWHIIGISPPVVDSDSLFCLEQWLLGNQLCTVSFTVITLQSVAQLITTVTECLSLSALPLQRNMDQPPHH